MLSPADGVVAELLAAERAYIWAKTIEVGVAISSAPICVSRPDGKMRWMPIVSVS